MARKPEENPSPHIGRKGKERKFSKSFEKKFQRRKPKETPRELTDAEQIQESFAEGRVGINVKIPRHFTDPADRVAILANEYGIENTAEMLGLDTDFVDNILQGFIPTIKQSAQLEHAYTGLQLENDEINFAEVEHYANNLEQAMIFANEVDFVGTKFKDTLRYSVANQQIDIKKHLENTGAAPSYFLFADGLTPAHKEKIFAFLLEGNDADEMFEAYNEDRDTFGTIWFDNEQGMQESHFWKWFRDTFYS